MEDQSNRHLDRIGLIVVAAVVIVFGGMILLGGGRVDRILSTVGGSIGNPAAGTTDTTANGSADEAGSGAGGSSGQIAAAAAAPPQLLIVRTGELDLEVAALGPTVESAGRVVTAAGGYISGSSEAGAGDDASATVVYHIPSMGWDATLGDIRRLATKVRRQQVDTEEVTGQVVDLGARIANLRATEAALQAIMARATKISDVLDVQKQLTATRGDIEKAVADKTQLEGRAAFGSLKVTFGLPVPAAVVTSQKGWDPATDVDRATGRLIRIGQAATSAGIFLAIVGLPVVLSAGVLLLIAWQLVRVSRWVVSRRTASGVLPG